VGKIKIQLQAFTFASDDPLAREHAEVAQWVEEAASSLGEHRYYQQLGFATRQKMMHSVATRTICPAG
jgi:hypothetical protein